MSEKSPIQWTDATLNAVIGCKRVSAGCDHCYAFQLHDQRHIAWKRGRFPTAPAQYHLPFSHVQLLPERLFIPFSWRKPRRVFFNSMSDLWHDDVPDWFIARTWAMMALTQQHTYQILTKRPERMLAWLRSDPHRAVLDEMKVFSARWPGRTFNDHTRFPLPNVHLGVSVEDQYTADERIPLLLETPAAVRFLSCEPLLGPVDLRPWLRPTCEVCKCVLGEVALDNEMREQQAQQSDGIVASVDFPPSYRLPPMLGCSQVIPAHESTKSGAKPFDYLSIGTVNGDANAVGLVSPASPVQVPLAVKEASDVADGSRVSGQRQDGRQQPRPLAPTLDASGFERTPDSRVSNPSLTSYRANALASHVGGDHFCACHCHTLRTPHYTTTRLHWCIIGGESGPHARPMDLAWAHSLVAQCQAAGVAPFVKQLGTVWARAHKASDSHGGTLEEWPADLQVREWPKEIRR